MDDYLALRRGTRSRQSAPSRLGERHPRIGFTVISRSIKDSAPSSNGSRGSSWLSGADWRLNAPDRGVSLMRCLVCQRDLLHRTGRRSDEEQKAGGPKWAGEGHVQYSGGSRLYTLHARSIRSRTDKTRPIHTISRSVNDVVLPNMENSGFQT